MDSEFEPWRWTAKRFYKTLNVLRNKYIQEGDFFENALKKTMNHEMTKKEVDALYEANLSLEIVRLYDKKGLNAQEIAEELKISKAKAGNRINKYLMTGESEPQQRGRRSKFKQRHKDFAMKYLKAHEGKVSLLDIKIAFDEVHKFEDLTVSVSSISNWLSEFGVEYSKLKS
jgi:transposase